MNPLFGDGAGDGGDVDAELVGHVDHGQRLEELGALVEELALGVDDGADDAQDRALALLDALDERKGDAS